MRWIEEPLAALQQAAAAAWLSTRALLWTRSSIILKKTQGSLYSQRSRLGEEPYSSPRQLISTALSLGLTPLQTNHPHSPPPLPPPSPTATNHWRSRVSPGRHNGSTSGRRRHRTRGRGRRTDIHPPTRQDQAPTPSPGNPRQATDRTAITPHKTLAPSRAPVRQLSLSLPVSS